jgi:small subunit ribosomal protein S15
MIENDVKKQVMKEYGQHEQDTGSVEVQIAMLTKQIQALTQHCKDHKSDFSSQRGLKIMIGQRRRFLNYLQRVNPGKYQELVNRIGIRA